MSPIEILLWAATYALAAIGVAAAAALCIVIVRSALHANVEPKK